jgi:hypothetical protein
MKLEFKWNWKLYAAMGFHLLGVVGIIIACSTPWWVVSWNRIHTPFNRVGLWEFCLNGYIVQGDISQTSYFGCWWIYSTYYGDIFKNLSPIWFVFIQVFVVLHLCLDVLLAIVLIIYFLGFFRHVSINSKVSKVMIIASCVGGIFGLVSTILFAIFWSDPNWMPYPELNWPSVSFGANVTATACSFIVAVFLIDRVLRDQEAIETHEEDFKMLPTPTDHLHAPGLGEPADDKSALLPPVSSGGQYPGASPAGTGTEAGAAAAASKQGYSAEPFDYGGQYATEDPAKYGVPQTQYTGGSARSDRFEKL